MGVTSKDLGTMDISEGDIGLERAGLQLGSTVWCALASLLFLHFLHWTYHLFIFDEHHVVGTEGSTEYDARHSFKAVDPFLSL